MSIGTFTELKTAIETWRERAGDTVITGNAADIIALAESAMTRELPIREMWINHPLSGTTDSRELALPADYVESKWLKRTDDDSFCRLKKQTSEAMRYYETTSIPEEWCINGDAIDLNRPCSAGLTFAFRYRKKFALATTTTNWLLTHHPDIYLSGVLVWSGLLIKDDDVAIWNNMWERGKQTLHYIEADADGDVEMQVDSGLLMGRRGRASVAELSS